jgi:hypothetical protein
MARTGTYLIGSDLVAVSVVEMILQVSPLCTSTVTNKDAWRVWRGRRRLGNLELACSTLKDVRYAGDICSAWTIYADVSTEIVLRTFILRDG